MAISTVPAAKAYIFGRLEAALSSTLAGVTLTWTYPTDEKSIGEEHIHFGDVEQDEEWGSIGAQRRTEDYTVELVVLTKVYGDDPRGTDERLWELREAVAAIVRASPSLGGLLIGSAQISATRTDLHPLSNAWAARARLSVHCNAHI